ncbi:hypothetical protein [Brevundimonas aurantiaca]|uniref:hypothetical protein n=1 Tax=Brevundimonas aurantiaca TaxID=74316 RepID=UPI001D18FAD0|nr:hypothetical protein [Brevundimonas aurantiaca]MCC4293472.1 hypothetical protein [Brevundimonas aurantiaca]
MAKMKQSHRLMVQRERFGRSMVWVLGQQAKSGGQQQSVASAGGFAEINGACLKDRLDLALRQRRHDET